MQDETEKNENQPEIQQTPNIEPVQQTVQPVLPVTQTNVTQTEQHNDKWAFLRRLALTIFVICFLISMGSLWLLYYLISLANGGASGTEFIILVFLPVYALLPYLFFIGVASGASYIFLKRTGRSIVVVGILTIILLCAGIFYLNQQSKARQEYEAQDLEYNRVMSKDELLGLIENCEIDALTLERSGDLWVGYVNNYDEQGDWVWKAQYADPDHYEEYTQAADAVEGVCETDVFYYDENIDQELEQSDESSESDNETEAESQLPSGWLRYTNSDFGFSFGYPFEWGDVEVGEVHYGSEQQAGPRISLTFTDCDACEPNKAIPLGSSTPEIALNSIDFGGVGTSRPLAIDAGYIENSNGSYIVYKQANTETIYSNDNTLELAVINNVLFIRQSDDFHNVDTTRAVVNLTDGGEYSGIGFIIHDTVGESANSEILRSIVETFEII